MSLGPEAAQAGRGALRDGQRRVDRGRGLALQRPGGRQRAAAEGDGLQHRGGLQ